MSFYPLSYTYIVIYLLLLFIFFPGRTSILALFELFVQPECTSQVTLKFCKKKKIYIYIYIYIIYIIIYI